MDNDYFETFSPEAIATHVRLSARVDSGHRVIVRITSRHEGEFDIIIVGYDYLSEFSIFCGLLSAFGLDIQAGDIFSFSKPSSGPSGHLLPEGEGPYLITVRFHSSQARWYPPFSPASRTFFASSGAR